MTSAERSSGIYLVVGYLVKFMRLFINFFLILYSVDVFPVTVGFRAQKYIAESDTEVEEMFRSTRFSSSFTLADTPGIGGSAGC